MSGQTKEEASLILKFYLWLCSCM